MKKLVLLMIMMVAMAMAQEPAKQVPTVPDATKLAFKDLQLRQAGMVVELYKLQDLMQKDAQQNQALMDQIQKMVEKEQTRIDASKKQWIVDPNTLEVKPAPKEEPKEAKKP